MLSLQMTHAVYSHGQEANLSCFQLAIEQFCDAFESKVDWHKSCAFWVAGGEPLGGSAAYSFDACL